jgi:hypothetical protein
MKIVRSSTGREEQFLRVASDVMGSKQNLSIVMTEYNDQPALINEPHLTNHP